MTSMTIGTLADQAGVSIDAIRFYERRGILAEPQRRPSGYRTYTPDDVDRIRLVKRLQALGFTLAEVTDALRPLDAGTATCDSERWRVEAVMARLDAQLAELRKVRRDVAQVLDVCKAGHCPHGRQRSAKL
ncbi:MAG: MerR family transcriptional regulator [Mycobacteriales bacterium]